jgi:CheY-like chemotaxis protein
VLIAEPNALRRAHYASLVATEGLVPKAVSDGAEAMDALDRSGVPELLVTELALPLVDGFQVIDRLRRAASASESPVLVISAFRELREDALLLRERLGIAAVVRATASTDAIRQVLRNVIARQEPVAAAVAAANAAAAPANAPPLRPTLRAAVDPPRTTPPPPSSHSGRANKPAESSRAAPPSAPAPPSAT